MKEYWITNSRFKLIAVILILMWIGIMIFFWMKADEVTKSPCQVCAKKIGEKVTCTIDNGGIIMERTYYPNFTIFNDAPGFDNPLI